jgi:competence protein ComEC
VTDRWAVALAVATAAGALHPSPVPVVVTVLVALAALAARRPLLLCVGAALLASALGQRALDGLDGVEAGTVQGEITLLTDPEPGPAGVRAEARLGRRRVELSAGGAAGAALEAALAGERFAVRGDLAPLPAGDWAVARHLAGRLRVHRAEPAGPADPLHRVANAARRTLVVGAAPLEPTQASLYAGLVIGDDRDQPVALTDDFRGAGLTHLLAVSGQNVAFVLALAGPALRRLRLWPRLLVTLALVGLFVVLTRAEPSVVRAGAMAAIGTATVTVGRPLSRLRGLALAATVLLLVDPLLVRALGFRLSVAATAAIVVLAAPLAAAVPGPRWLAEPLAVTLAAQAGVAPFLVSTFGPLPLASVPANLLVVPAAGAVMAWGMSAGLVAGVLGAGVAEVVHLPTRLLLGWIEAVASRAAAAPLGQLDGTALVVVGCATVAVLAARRSRGLRLAAAGAVLAGAVLVAAVAGANAPPPLRSALTPGVVRWHGGGTDVVVLGGGGWRSPLSPATALEALREDGVGAIDVLVVADAGVRGTVVEALGERHPTGAVLVPVGLAPADRPAGAVPVPASGATLEVGDLLVVMVPGEERLVVEAWPAPR